MGREFLHKSWEKVAGRRRLLLLFLVLLPTIIASGFMAQALPRKGAGVPEFVLVLFFAVLYAWISIGFWASVMGFFSLMRGFDRFLVTGRERDAGIVVTDEARTAILIPVYNEAVDRVVAGIYATYCSLQRAGRLELFDFYILSDSTDPDRWVEEEVAWHGLCRATGGRDRIFYRNRRSNVKRKSGNIADFCRKWGYRYRYMIVFDADSIMSGATLYRLVETMEGHPTVGILQTSPKAINATTLFARLQQFASHLYSPVFSAGLHFWQLGDAQYWGHNAIIRTEPFRQHCALPELTGKPPLGGFILSHDFVEAALMRGAGWGVWLAYDLAGSYEEVPPTLLDELKRDRRWCQGNMQHLRLLFKKGIFPAHRVLFLTGAMSYVSGLLWFLFLLLSTAEALFEAIVPPAYFPAGQTLFPQWPVWNPGWAITLGFSTLLLLLLPKILSVVLLAGKQRRAGEFGGLARLMLSTMLEILLSTLLAPIRMLFHSKFVFSIAIGRQVGWKTQQRQDHGTSWSEAWRFHGWGVVLGLIWGAVVLVIAPTFFWWLTPILLALVVSVPLSVWSSRTAVGLKFQRMGLFLSPDESHPSRELRSAQSYQQSYLAAASALPVDREQGFIRAVVDPGVHALHLALLRQDRRYSGEILRSRRQLRDKALSLGPESLSPVEKKTLLRDPALLKSLHQAVWELADEGQACKWGLALRTVAPPAYRFVIAPKKHNLIAYFSMEFGLQESIPTYSGGLGILAGDTVKSFADLGVEVVAVTLLSERGYFYQRLDESGHQLEHDNIWSPGDFMKRLDCEVELSLQGRPVYVTAWVYEVTGVGGGQVPVLFLDTNLEKNSEEDRLITGYLFGGDHEYRLKQEIVLGIGGVRILRQLEMFPRKFHMNEGHAAFLTIELYHELAALSDPYERLEKIRGQCAFTTHTPIAAGHDTFVLQLIEAYLPQCLPPEILKMVEQDGNFSMTLLALTFSGYVNGVSKRHGETSAAMFPDHVFDYITNGVHSATWINPHLAGVMDRYGIEWRRNPSDLRNVLSVPLEELRGAHDNAKKELIDYINVRENAGLEYEIFTIGFARRMTAYKRAGLLLLDCETLEKIDRETGRLQIIYAGKAHRRDEEGKAIIAAIIAQAKSLRGRLRVVFVQDYNMHIARLMTAGVDLWLNTPERPMEACGTSGMKAAHNGVPSLSILDGWWVEGWLEGVTGWAIGEDGPAGAGVEQDPEEKDAFDAASLYDKLAKVIVPLYYHRPMEYLQVMRSTLAINGSYFNSTRMVQQYLVRAYAGERNEQLQQLSEEWSAGASSRHPAGAGDGAVGDCER